MPQEELRRQDSLTLGKFPKELGAVEIGPFGRYVEQAQVMRGLRLVGALVQVPPKRNTVETPDA